MYHATPEEHLCYVFVIFFEPMECFETIHEHGFLKALACASKAASEESATLWWGQYSPQGEFILRSIRKPVELKEDFIHPLDKQVKLFPQLSFPIAALLRRRTRLTSEQHDSDG